MAKRTLAELTQQYTQKTSDSSGSPVWKLFFNFWKADMDTLSVFRFLPDLDESNPMGFLVENHCHELVINGKREKVPCLKMYGEECPICALSQKYYDEKSPDYNEALGKKYYRKKSYIGQGLVVSTPIEHDVDQLVKLIEFGPAIYKQIQSAFVSGDLAEVPYELKGGYDFRIRKTKSGDYASYTTSNFSPKQTDVGDDIIERIELFDLKQYRTAYIPRAQLEAMLVADQTGSAYGAAAQSGADNELKLNRKAEQAETPAATEPSTTSVASTSSGAPKMSAVEMLRAKAAAAAARANQNA